MRIVCGASAVAGFSLLAAIQGRPVFAAEPNPAVEIAIEGRGKVVIELFVKDAPKTTGHFIELVRRKFYDGLVFHRVVTGFVAQAGDPGTRKATAQEIAAKDDHAGGTIGFGAAGSGPN